MLAIIACLTGVHPDPRPRDNCSSPGMVLMVRMHPHENRGFTKNLATQVLVFSRTDDVPHSD